MMVEKGTPLASFVLPMFKFLNYCHMCPSTFIFVSDSQSFQHLPGPLLKKAMCVIILAVVIWVDFITAIFYARQIKKPELVILYQFMGYTYYGFHFAFAYSLMTKGDQVCLILNSLQDLTLDVKLYESSFAARRKIRLICIILTVVFAFKSLHFIFMVADVKEGVSIFNDDIATYLRKTAANGIGNFKTSLNPNRNQTRSSQVNSIGVGVYEFHDTVPTPVITGIGIVFVYVNFVSAFYWDSLYLTICLWSLLFYHAIQSFLKSMNNDCPNTPVLKSILNFNRITQMMQIFNGAYGVTTLFSILSCIAHCSMEVMGFYVSTHGIIATGAMLLMYIFQLTLAARVPALASQMIEKIKLRYQNSLQWKKCCGKCNETTQAMLVLLHDVQMKNVGLTGSGIFTITFSFIGSIISAITTYAIVVIQFTNGQEY